MKPSQPRNFFNQLREGGQPAITALYSGYFKSNEEDWFECKGFEKIPDDDIKAIWSKNIAAFANTGGGILIWGLNARKDSKTKVDCVIGSSLVTNVHTLRSRLQELTAQATDPPMSGIEIVAIEDGATPPAGFVLCFVPEGESKPYRAEQAGRNYFIRAGAATCVPSPALLRSLFFPHYHAALSVMTQVNKVEEHKYRIVFTVHNSGIATAKDVIVGIQCEDSPPVLGQLDHGPSWHKIPYPDGSGTDKHAYICDQPMHPGMQSEALTYQRRFVPGETTRNFVLHAQIVLYCENNEPSNFSIEYTRNEIEDRIRKNGIPS